MEIKINLSSTEHKDLLSYCNLNDLLISSVVKDSFNTGFNIQRYGLLNSNENVVGKEVIVEKIVEVPIEIIKYVDREVITEVKVEVPVEKIFHDNSKTDEEVKKFSTKMTEMENIFQNEKNELLLKIQQLEERGPEIVEVIKEVVVEKEINDEGLKPKIEALQNTVQKLKQDNIDKDRKIKEYEKTIQEIQMVQDRQAIYLRGSNLNKTL
jgi:hypothetical protein